MSPAHCCAVQMAFDRIVEQPTERSLTWDCKQARTRPPPGLTSAHRDLTSTVQSRSEVNNPSCALAPTEPVSSNAAPSAIVVKAVFMTVSPFRLMTSPLEPRDIPACGSPILRAPPLRALLRAPSVLCASGDACGGDCRAASGAA